MFRSIFVSLGDYISTKENWLYVNTEDDEKRIPIEDIFSVIIDNPRVQLSVNSMNAITNTGAFIVLCNDKHMPETVVLPLTNYYRPLNTQIIQSQLNEEIKQALWRKIINCKIENQANVLLKCCGTIEVRNRMVELAQAVTGDDDDNCEGVAAKMYFRNMYGSEFLRNNDNAINSALNYGYAIIRSCVTNTLVSHGFNCVLGIHHKNTFNQFNLSDDIMEPLRPLVDQWVSINAETLVLELTKEHRMSLVNILNERILINGRKETLRNAIEIYVKSFLKSMTCEDPSLLLIPKI